MAINIVHKNLFEVKILHHYFLNKGDAVFDNMTPAGKAAQLRDYDLRQVLRFEPTDATAALLRKHRCTFRATSGGLMTGVQTVKEGANIVPAIAFNNDTRLTFTADVADTLFSNYTALPLLQNKGACFYFQNRTTASAKKFPYLSRNPAAFSAGSYSAGDIVSDNAANPAQLFIAKKVVNAAPPGADWLADTLVSGQPLLYATQTDEMQVRGPLLRYETGRDDVLPTVTITNRKGQVLEPKFDLFMENDLLTVQVKLHGYPEDLYSLSVKDAAKAYEGKLDFFLLHSGQTPFAIIDLNVKSDAAAYDMLGVNNELLSPVYQLRFRNRLTQWRYLGKPLKTPPSEGPYPLTKKGVLDLSGVGMDDKPVEDLPNAEVNMIKTEFPLAGQKKYNTISEIYIH